MTRGGATLNLSGWTHTKGGQERDGDWHYRADTGPHSGLGYCSPAQTGNSVVLSGLDSGTEYIYTMYQSRIVPDIGRVGCYAAVFTSPSFKTPGQVMTATTATTTATLAIPGYTSSWYYRHDGAGASCQGPVSGGAAVPVSGLTHNTEYVFKAYSNSSCTTEIASKRAVTQTPTLAAANLSLTGATLTISNWNAGTDGNWYYQANAGPDTTCSSPQTTNSAAITGLSSNTSYTYRAYNAPGCAGSNLLATAAAFTTSNYGARDTSKEFNLHADNKDATGIWSNGTTIWVADWHLDKVYAYALATGARDTSKEFNLHADNADATGIWSNGATIWVSDITDNKLYAYKVSDKTRDTGKDITLHTDNADATDIWSDDATIWVSDEGDDKLYAYTLATGARDKSKEFDLHADNDHPRGIWSDGRIIWVPDHHEAKAYAYVLATGARYTAKELSLDSGNSNSQGVWSDGTTIWVADWHFDKVFAYYSPAIGTELRVGDVGVGKATLTLWYHTQSWWYQHGGSGAPCVPVSSGTNTVNLTGLAEGASYTFQAYDKTGCNAADLIATASAFTTFSSGARLPEKDLNTLNAAGNNSPNGMWSDGTTIWVADYGDTTLYAYTLATGARDSAKDITTTAGSQYNYAMASDGSTLWVSNLLNAGTKLWAYKMNPGQSDYGDRDSSKDITLHYAGGGRRGIWTNGETIWIMDRFNGGNIYAYGVDGSRQTDKEFSLNLPLAWLRSIWSDGFTLFLTDSRYRNVHAFNLVSGTRDTDKEFVLPTANGWPTGIWSDRETLWVADSGDDKVYAYRARPTTTELRVIDIDKTTATLSLLYHSNDWWYQSATTGQTTCTKVSSGTNTADLTGLTVNTSYTFKAYDKTGCNAADLIATADTFTAWPLGGTRDSAKDITLDSANANSYGNWSDGTTLWVADHDDTKLYAYKMSDQTRDSAKDITLDSANSDATGIWSNNTTIWVPDDRDDKLFAYKMSDKTRDSAKDITLADSTELHLDNGDATGIWSDGATIWVGDPLDDKLYAYTLNGGARDPAKDITLHADNGSSNDIWSDGTVIWVSDGSGAVFAYDLASGARNTAQEFFISPTWSRSIWSDGTTMWVSDNNNGKLLAHYAPRQVTALRVSDVGTTTATLWIQHHSGAWWYQSDARSAPCVAVSSGTTKADLTGLTPDAGYIYRAYDAAGCGAADLIATADAFTTFSGGERYPSRDFDMSFDSTNPYGLWSNGATMWVLDNTGDKIWAYKLLGKTRDTSKEFSSTELRRANSAIVPRDIWSDGNTMWVADDNDNKVYAYKMSDQTRDSAKDITLDNANGSPYGMWSDGTTLWVSDVIADKLFAYTLNGGARAAGKDLNTLTTAGNNDPYHIWSNGETMWVVDYDDDKVYAYTLNGGARDMDKEFPLTTHSDSQATGIWSDGATIYVVGRPSQGSDKVFGYHAYPQVKALTVGDIGVTTAKLSLSYHGGAWWYQSATTGQTTCTKVSSGTNAADLTGLTSGAAYTYQAYDKTGCNDADLIATANAFTTLSVGDRDPVQDLAVPSTDTARNIQGIWSDGTTIWVNGGGDGRKFLAYTLATGARDAGKDFNGIYFGYAIAGHGTTIFLLTAINPTKLEAFTRADATANWAGDADKDVTLDRFSNNHASGVATDGRTVWVADNADDKLYAYNFADGVRDASQEFNLHPHNGNPGSMWTDGSVIWVLDEYDDKVYAYDLSDGSRLPDKEYDGLKAAGNTAPDGLWSDGATLWISNGDTEDNKLYAYAAYPGLPFLTATAAGAATAQLVVGNYQGDWYYQADAGPHAATCTAVGSGTTTADITGLVPGATYTYTAYQDGSCSTVLDAALPLTLPVAVLTASFRSTTATLTLAGWAPSIDGSWYYKADVGPHAANCSAAQTKATADLTGLTAESAYTYTAYRDNNCSTVLDVAPAFRTHLYEATLAAGDPTGTTMPLTLTNYGGDWWYKYTVPATPAGTCTAADSGATEARATGLTKNTGYTFNAYSASGCANTDLIATVVKSTADPTLTVSKIKSETATLVLDGWDPAHDGEWKFKGDSPFNGCYYGGATKGAASRIAARAYKALTPGATYTFRAYAGASCVNAALIDTADAFTTAATLQPEEFDSGKVYGPSDLKSGVVDDHGHEDLFRDVIDIWSDGTTLWAYSGDLGKLVAFNLSNRARDMGKDIEVASVWRPVSFTSDGETVWVGQKYLNRLWAYSLSGRTRVPAKDITLDAENGDRSALWTDGTTIWVADNDDDKLYAYAVANGASQDDKEIEIEDLEAVAMWSDGTTLWIPAASWPVSPSQNSGTGMFAYNLSDGSRQPVKDYDYYWADTPSYGISLFRSVPAFPDGIWSDGATTWVASTVTVNLRHDRSIILAYKAIPPTKRLAASSITATAATLTLHWHTDAWWYERTAGSPADTTCYSVGAGTTTADLTGLTAGTDYTYTAYSDSSCTDANKLSAVTFTAQAAGGAGAFGASAQSGAADTGLPVLRIETSGAATWEYTLPPGAPHVSTELRWVATAGLKSADWTGKQSQVFSDGSVTGYTVAGLQQGVEYKAQVIVTLTVGGVPRTVESALLVFTVPVPGGPPGNVSWVTAVHNGDNVSALWPAVSNADGYEGRYSDDDGATWTSATVPAVGTTLTIESLSSEKTYVVGVRATNASGEGAWTNSAAVSAGAAPAQASQPPAAVASVTATRAEGSVTASWDGITNATGYDVVYSTDDGSSWTRAATNQAETSYTLSNADASLAYVIGVRAVNAAGESDWTNSETVPVNAGSPALTVGNDGAASWSYTLPQDAQYVYTELRWVGTAGQAAADWSGAKTEVFYDGSANKYAITGLTAGVEYKAKVTYALTINGEDRFAKSDTVVFTMPPEAVASVTASRYSGSITASWDAASGATGYDVVYSTDDGTTWTRATTNQADTSYALSGADSSLAYVIGVRSVNAGGESVWNNSATVPAVAPGQAPDEVTNLSASRQDGGIVATWDAVDGATKYHVTYSTDGTANWSLAAAEHDTNSITIANADSALPYILGVRAGNAAGWSDWVNSDETPAVQPPPGSVGSVKASRKDGRIAAGWDVVTGATGYDVRYSADAGATWTRAATNQSETSYTLSGADDSLAYMVGVRAVNSAGESGWTNSAAVPALPQQPAQAPGAVTNLSASRDNSSITVSWDAVDGATKYHITYSTDGGASWSLAAGEHTTNSITVANADGNLPYIVGVRAGNATGWSGWVNSNEVPAGSSNDQGASTQ